MIESLIILSGWIMAVILFFILIAVDSKRNIANINLERWRDLAIRTENKLKSIIRKWEV